MVPEKAKSGGNELNAEGIAKALPVVAPAARAGKRESESEAAQKLPEIIQKFMPNGLLNCLIVKLSNCQIKMTHD